jgi:hypothetical protein
MTALAAKSTGVPTKIGFLVVDVKQASRLTTGSMSVMAIFRQLTGLHARVIRFVESSVNDRRNQI